MFHHRRRYSSEPGIAASFNQKTVKAVILRRPAPQVLFFKCQFTPTAGVLQFEVHFVIRRWFPRGKRSDCNALETDQDFVNLPHFVGAKGCDSDAPA